MTEIRLVRLQDICIQDRKIVKPEEGVSLRYIGLESIEANTGQFLNGALSKTPEFPQGNSFSFNPQHVLYGKLRPYLNKVALPEFEGKCSTEIIPLLPKPGLERAYLAYYLRSSHVVSQVIKKTAGSRMPRADMDFVLNLQIPLPSLSEQHRIVDILSRAEGIVQLRREAEKKAAEIIPALFIDMFGDPATNPKGWPMTSVGQIATYTRYGPRFPDRQYTDEGAHILRTTDMGYNGELRWFEAPILPMSKEEIEKYSLKPKTLLVTRTGATIGKTALFEDSSKPCIAGAYLIEIGVSADVIPEYVLQFFLSRVGQSYLIGGSRAVAQPNINAPTIKAIPIPLPDYKLQLAFADQISKIKSIQTQQIEATQKAKAAFDALLAKFFTK
jgi:type I restriction enzyme S subunit